jgi:hypothetical protein
MAGNYQTYMVDPLNALKDGLGPAVQKELQTLFQTIVAASKVFSSNTVIFTPTAASPAGHGLLVYFMPSKTSVVKHVPKTPALDLTNDGNTVYAAGASEVYVAKKDSALLARLALHELMHNRLKLGNDLHTQGGMAAQTIGPSTQLNATNIKTMAAVLDKSITQWTDGIALLNSGKNDMFSEYYQV